MPSSFTLEGPTEEEFRKLYPELSEDPGFPWEDRASRANELRDEVEPELDEVAEDTRETALSIAFAKAKKLKK